MNGDFWSTPNDLTYYVDQSTINEGYTKYADYGARAWNPSSYIYVYKSSGSTNNGNKTTIASSDENDLGGYYATTTKYKSDGSMCQAGYYCNQYRVKIIINDPDYAKLSEVHRYETITHEMGHSLGLYHENYVWSIMVATGWIDNEDPTTDDWNGIKAIYNP